MRTSLLASLAFAVAALAAPQAAGDISSIDEVEEAVTRDAFKQGTFLHIVIAA